MAEVRFHDGAFRAEMQGNAASPDWCDCLGIAQGDLPTRHGHLQGAKRSQERRADTGT